jgi:hypothetical protein
MLFPECQKKVGNFSQRDIDALNLLRIAHLKGLVTRAKKRKPVSLHSSFDAIKEIDGLLYRDRKAKKT